MYKKKKKEVGCCIIVHKVKCVLNRYCNENFRLWRGNHLICRENTVCHSTDRRLHSHIKGKGAYSVVPVSLSLAQRKSSDELYVIYFTHFENALLSFHFTLLNWMSKKFRDLFPIHTFFEIARKLETEMDNCTEHCLVHPQTAWFVRGEGGGGVWIWQVCTYQLLVIRDCNFISGNWCYSYLLCNIVVRKQIFNC